jgi:hypothetical protein
VPYGRYLELRVGVLVPSRFLWLKGRCTVPTTLTRQQMEDTIRQGGSVIIDGRSYASIESLPSEADLAKGDESREKALLATFDQQLANISRQREDLLKQQQDRRAAAAKQQQEQQGEPPTAQTKPPQPGTPPAPSEARAPSPPPAGEGEQPQARQRFGPRKVE